MIATDGLKLPPDTARIAFSRPRPRLSPLGAVLGTG